ncbi:hypothetical protein ACIQ9Q_33335 [Streptomyces sp. NPDC094438]|uniref:hypothetical protein n=1 Tax=Streptomyces sp. NPDC094438 TaxID=3366061 RepID=UPI00381CF916
MVVDFGLSQRSLLAVAGRADQVADLITRRLSILTQNSYSQSVDPAAVRAIVHQAVHDVRSTPARRAADHFTGRRPRRRSVCRREPAGG